MNSDKNHIAFMCDDESSLDLSFWLEEGIYLKKFDTLIWQCESNLKLTELWQNIKKFGQGR